MPYTEYTSDVALCRQIHRAYGKSFYFGTFFFSPEERAATSILYAFVRFPDEYVDTYYAAERDVALTKLTRWRDLWDRCYRGETFDASADEARILRAARYVFTRYRIPYEYSTAFLDAMVQDTHQDRYPTYAALENYMYGSATVVGLMMTYILCARDAAFTEDASYRDELLGYARALGEAFQLTNFLRDIAEDLRVRGRIYLPADDMQACGVTEEDLRASRVTPGFVSLMEREIARARQLYMEADRGIELLPRRAARGVRVARVLYSELLRRIELARYDVFARRVHLSFTEKLTLTLRTLLHLW